MDNESVEKYTFSFETNSKPKTEYSPPRRTSIQQNHVARTSTNSDSRSSSVSLEDPFVDTPSLHWEDNLSTFEKRRQILQSQLTGLNNQRKVFLKDLDQTEAKIEQTAARLHKTIDGDRKQLLLETEKLRNDTLVELDKAEKDLQLAINSLQDFMKESSSSFPINGELESSKDINMNITNPLAFTKFLSEFSLPEINVSSVKFKKMEIIGGNILGRVSMLDIDSSDPYVDVPYRVFAIGGQETVAGLVVMKREIFVLRELSSFLDVYRASDGAPVRRIKLENLRKPADIVAQYIFNYTNNLFL